jgi:RNA polymerase-binding transcription factor DksA
MSCCCPKGAVSQLEKKKEEGAVRVEEESVFCERCGEPIARETCKHDAAKIKQRCNFCHAQWKREQGQSVPKGSEAD